MSMFAFMGRTAKDLCLGCIALAPLALFTFVFYYLVIFFEKIGALIFILAYTGRKLRRKERWLLNIVEQGIGKIPFFGGWYITIRDMIQTFTSGSGAKGYLGTAKVPCATGYIIGFVTNKMKEKDGSVTVTIFVPTSPNPTTGLVFFFPEKDVEYIDMTPEKAFSKIISLGMK